MSEIDQARAELSSADGKQRDQTLRYRRMREDCIPQSGVGQSTEHRDLYASHNLSCAYTERLKAKDAIAVAFHQALQESARFHQASRP